MKFNLLPMLAAFTAAQVTYEDVSKDYKFLKWEAPSVMQKWYTDNGHTNELFIDAGALSSSDIGRELDLRIVERTQPFGDTSFLQIYYDGFTSPYQVLDYECFVGCENNRIVEVGRTFSLDTTLKGKYANYLVLELTPDFNNNDEFSIAFIPVKTLADVKGTFYSEAYEKAIALNAPKDISLGTSYATIAENGGKADVWANFATADYVIDVNGNIPVWSVIGSPGNTIGISFMTADQPTFDSNGWKKAKLYGRTTMADGSVDPGRNFETSDSNQFLSADGYVNPVKRDTNEMWYVYTELLINRDARAGDIVDLTFTVSGDQYPVTVEVDDGKVERLQINELDYGIFDYQITAPFNIIEFWLTFYQKNNFFTLFAGLCAIGAFWFDVYMAGLGWFEYKKEDLVLTKTERFGQ